MMKSGHEREEEGLLVFKVERSGLLGQVVSNFLDHLGQSLYVF